MKSSAPTKVIISGEHSVVYGALSIAVPLDKRNEFTVTEEEGGPALIVTNPWEAGEGIYRADGSFEGGEFLRCYSALAKEFFKQRKFEKHLTFDLKPSGSPKGTGNSASIAAAFAYGLAGAYGIEMDSEEAFELVQAFEQEAHGGRSSGVDARTVLSDKTVEFYKEFTESGIKYHFEKKELELPEGTVLLIISTKRDGENVMTTGELVQKFAESYDFKEKPQDLTQEQRDEVVAPFNAITKKIISELRSNGDAAKLGALFNENHELLKARGVSSDSIEEARASCINAGALGAKLTGAGGPGGAIIALVEKYKVKEIEEAIQVRGFEVVDARISKKGPEVI